jgi:hypothetical protein
MPDYDDTDRRDDGFDDRSGGGDDRVIRRAKELVKAPAIGLIIIGILSALGAVGYGINMASFDVQWEQAVKDQEQKNANMTPQQKQEMQDMMNNIKEPARVAVGVFALTALAVGAIALLGGVKMMGLRGRGLAYTGAVLSMIPCVSGCCLAGIPLGIWVIMTLNKPEVKAGFAAVARGGSGGLD